MTFIFKSKICRINRRHFEILVVSENCILCCMSTIISYPMAHLTSKYKKMEYVVWNTVGIRKCYSRSMSHNQFWTSYNCSISTYCMYYAAMTKVYHHRSQDSIPQTKYEKYSLAILKGHSWYSELSIIFTSCYCFTIFFIIQSTSSREK